MKFDLAKAKQILPESLLCASEHLPKSRPPRLLSAMAFSPTLEASFSGSTYYLAKAGLATRNLEGCFSLYSGQRPLRSLKIRGALWKVQRLLTRRKSGGFKFTSAYLDEVWPRHIGALAGATVVNNFQMYGREFVKRRKALGIGAYFYIDGTLSEYFEDYAEFDVSEIAKSTKKHAIEIEKQGYEAADGIIAMSRLTAHALQQRYGIPNEKIAVVVPGANLPDEELDRAGIPEAGDPSREFLLGFVGLYPLRKGLDRLAKAVQILRGRGLPVRLRVVGNCPEELRAAEGVEYLGVINKKTDFDYFLRAIGSVHLGCLVSRSELAGIAVLEFLRVGVPVLGTRVGGMTDILEGGGSLIVSPDVSPDELADEIARVHLNPDHYTTLKREAQNRRAWASWRRAAAELAAALPY